MTTLSSTVIPPDSPRRETREFPMDDQSPIMTRCETPPKVKEDAIPAVTVTPEVVLKGRMSMERNEEDDGPSPRSLEAQLLAAQTDAQETLTALLNFAEGVRKITREFVKEERKEEEQKDEYLEDIVGELKGTVFATDLSRLWQAAHMIGEHARLVSQDVSMSVREVSVARQTALEAMERCHKAEAMATRVRKENVQLRSKLSTLATEKKVLIKEVKSLRTVLKDAKKQSTWNLLEQHIANALALHERQLYCGGGGSVQQQEEKDEEGMQEEMNETVTQEEKPHEDKSATHTTEPRQEEATEVDETIPESQEESEACEIDETTVESEAAQVETLAAPTESLIVIRSQTDEAVESEKPSSSKSMVVVRSNIEVINTPSIAKDESLTDNDDEQSTTEERRRPSSARGLGFGGFGRPKWMLSNEKRESRIIQEKKRQNKELNKKLKNKKEDPLQAKSDKQVGKKDDQEPTKKLKDEKPEIVKVSSAPQVVSATQETTSEESSSATTTTAVADEQGGSKPRRGPVKTANSYMPIKLSTSGRLSPTWGSGRSKASATTSANNDSKGTAVEPQQPQQQQHFGVMKFFGRRSPPAGGQAIKRPTPLIAVEALVPKDADGNDQEEGVGEKHHVPTKSPSASTCCPTVSTSNSPTPSNIKVCTLDDSHDDSKQFQTPRHSSNSRMPSSVSIPHPQKKNSDDESDDDGSSRTSVSSSHLLSPPQLSPIGAFASPTGSFHLPNHSCDPKILRSLAIPSTPSSFDSSCPIIPDEEIGKCYEA